MSNSVDPDETAHYEPSHLDLCCLQKPIIITSSSERVKEFRFTFKKGNCQNCLLPFWKRVYSKRIFFFFFFFVLFLFSEVLNLILS